jgi:hypothetical protein
MIDAAIQEHVYTNQSRQRAAVLPLPAAWGIRCAGADLLSFVTGGAERWRIHSSGHLLAVDDNTYDIGASGATRPKDLYLGGAVKGGAWQATAVATQYGGTGQDFSATAQGNTLYFSAAGVMAVLAPGTSGQFLKTQGAAANPVWATLISGATQIAIARKTADESVTSSVALQDDDELLFAIGASEVWVFQFNIIYGAGSTGDISVGVGAPALATANWTSFGIDVAATSPGNFKGIGGNISSNNTYGGSGASKAPLVMYGVVTNSTNAGNVTFKWAQSVSNGTATTVNEGSWLVAYRVA